MRLAPRTWPAVMQREATSHRRRRARTRTRTSHASHAASIPVGPHPYRTPRRASPPAAARKGSSQPAPWSRESWRTACHRPPTAPRKRPTCWTCCGAHPRTGHESCRSRRVLPQRFKAAPAAPLARRQRRALPLGRPARRTPGHACWLRRSARLTRYAGRCCT
jgi:hypothetical protein